MMTQKYPIVALNLHSSKEPFWNWLGVHQIGMGKEVSSIFPVHVIQHIFQITLSYFLPAVSHRAILDCIFRYRPQRRFITNGSLTSNGGVPLKTHSIISKGCPYKIHPIAIYGNFSMVTVKNIDFWQWLKWIGPIFCTLKKNVVTFKKT